MVFDADRVFAHEICKPLDRGLAPNGAFQWFAPAKPVHGNPLQRLKWLFGGVVYKREETLSAASVDEITG